MMKLKILSLRILAAATGIPLYIQVISFGNKLVNGNDFFLVIAGLFIIMISLFIPSAILIKTIIKKIDKKEASDLGKEQASCKNEEFLV